MKDLDSKIKKYNLFFAKVLYFCVESTIIVLQG